MWRISSAAVHQFKLFSHLLNWRMLPQVNLMYTVYAFQFAVLKIKEDEIMQTLTCIHLKWENKKLAVKM